MTAAMEQATSLAAELIASTYAAADEAEGRRNCTRILNQLKRGIVSKLSREESLELMAADAGDAANDDEHGTLAAGLLSIADNNDDFPTEGQRETSVEILKGLFRRAFCADEDGEEGGEALGKEERHQATLIRLFRQCSCTFQSRMSRCQTPSKDAFHHGTSTEPAEPSEHIRLLLVELMVDMGGYCSASLEDECSEEGSGSNDIIEATSHLCHTLAKSTLLDPCPEVQRAACDLVEVLARLCPLDATSLLVPLTGKLDEAIGGAGQQSASSAAALSKKCLFRHRHSKTRCKAVDASAAIVMCCPREGMSGSDKAASGNDTPDDTQPSATDHLSSYGSRSSSMEQMLLDTLLNVWEDLLKMDPSATVQIAVLKCLGNVATLLEWEHPPKSLATDASNTDVPSQVKARVLALLFAGMSPGSANQVRATAVQNLTCLPNGTSESSTNEHSLPRDTLVAYFQPVLELILDACSREWAPCQSKLRSLEALQVLLSVAIPLTEDDASFATKVTLSNVMVRSIMDVLSNNILSEDKEVLEAALACCRIIGCNNRCVASIYASGDTKENVQTNDADSVDDQQTAIESSPRQMTSMLLTLDGLMKGCLRNKDAVSILHDIDPSLAIPTPSWFPFSATAISSMLCNPTIINNVASNSSLAWALLDACGSFVQCVQQPQGDDNQWDPPKDVIINLLISITYLLSCPGEFDISPHAMSALEIFSSSQSCEAPSSLLDTHFREVLQRITSSSPPFPWQQSDPPFLAMDAVLRACSGFTVGSNFDLVAPFFLSHLTTAAYSKNDNGSDSAHHQSLIGSTAKDELAEEYSLRLSLMALLQTILSDESFAQTLNPGTSGVVSSFSAQFTTDVLLSLVVPNLVWKAGGMASALRKLAAFTLLSLLRASNSSQAEGERGSALLHSETATSLIPILHSNLEDTESTTRELSCACLSLALEQLSTETFETIWETNPRVIDTLHPRLLALLDDSHDAVRIGACKALEAFLIVAHATASRSSFDLGLSALDGIITLLLIQLDDPNEEIQSNVFHVLSVLIQLQYDESSPKEAVVEMIKRKLNTSSNAHRDGSYCRALLQMVPE